MVEENADATLHFVNILAPICKYSAFSIRSYVNWNSKDVLETITGSVKVFFLLLFV